MSTSEIKDKISKLSQSEQDEIMYFMIELNGNSDFDLSQECKEEIDRREAAHRAGKMSVRPAREVSKEWRKRLKNI